MVARVPKPTRYKLVLAALAAWLQPEPPAPPSQRETPRRERFFDRPFPFLVRCRGVLLPCTLVEVEGEDAARSARRDLEARAIALRN